MLQKGKQRAVTGPQTHLKEGNWRAQGSTVLPSIAYVAYDLSHCDPAYHIRVESSADYRSIQRQELSTEQQANIDDRTSNDTKSPSFGMQQGSDKQSR